MDEHAGLRKHKLMTKALAKTLPPLYTYSDSEIPLEKIPVAMKYFSPYTGWTWYVIEGDPVDARGEVVPRVLSDQAEDWLLFAMVYGWEDELGYVSLKELESVLFAGKVPAVERDLHFTPKDLGEAADERSR